MKLVRLPLGEIANLLGDQQTRRWNACISPRALDIDIGTTCTTYLHPTKGVRKVSNRRLGISGAFGVAADRPVQTPAAPDSKWPDPKHAARLAAKAARRAALAA